jgi:hypothetical protein
MAPLLFAAVLWTAPAAFEIAPGAAHRVELPAVAAGAHLVVRARYPYWRPAGSNPAFRIELNGADVGAMRDRRRTRVVSAPESPAGLPRFDFGLWRAPYAPVTTSGDDLVLEVSDLVRADGPNVLVLDHTASATAPLEVDALRLDDAPAAERRELVAPPDWRRPRLALPDAPRFTASADPAHVTVSWDGATAEVRTSVTGGRHEWSREIVTKPTHVEVRDTIRNPGDAVTGLHVRHALATDAEWLHVGGRSDPAVGDAYDPWNPTVFTPLGSHGLGLVAEDDVFRQQLHTDFDPVSSTLGLRTDLLCLAPGDAVTLVWSVYPTATGDYWDFSNRLRADWDVNRTIPGSYCWFRPDDVLAMSDDALAAALARQGTGVCSLWGGWVDPGSHAHPPPIGFGTFVLADAFASYRDRIRAAVAKLKAARPGIRVLVYFDAQRDSSPDARTRYADSVLLGPGGKPESTDWGGRFTPSFGMVPTEENRFGVALGAVPPAMRALGADGLYWDEMDAVDYTGPRFTTATWDRRSCLLGPGGEVRQQIGLVNLLSDPVKAVYARDGFVLGNSPPTTRRFQKGAAIRMIEAQHNDAWGAFAHLSDPLGYISGRRTDWDVVLDKVGEGLLVASARLDYPYDVLRRLFPFTPEYLQPGTLRGRERIVTVVSGTHGWASGGAAVRLWRYDASGREHEGRWHVKPRGDGVLVRVVLGPRELAVLERPGS